MKIFLHPELIGLLAELVQLYSALASRRSMVRGTEHTTNDTSMTNLVGQDAFGQARLLGQSSGEEAFRNTNVDKLCLLVARESAPELNRDDHRKTD